MVALLVVLNLRRSRSHCFNLYRYTLLGPAEEDPTAEAAFAIVTSAYLTEGTPAIFPSHPVACSSIEYLDEGNCEDAAVLRLGAPLTCLLRKNDSSIPCFSTREPETLISTSELDASGSNGNVRALASAYKLLQVQIARAGRRNISLDE